MEGNINIEKQDEFIAQYPEFNVGLEQNKIISKDKDDAIATTIEKRTSIENGEMLLKEITSAYYALDESIPYGNF